MHLHFSICNVLPLLQNKFGQQGFSFSFLGKKKSTMICTALTIAEKQEKQLKHKTKADENIKQSP